MIRLYKHAYVGDWYIIILLMILCATGLLVLYSATSASDVPYSPFFIKQVCGLCIGALLAALIASISYKQLLLWGQLIHYGVIILLIVTLCKGSSAMGAQRWIQVGFIKFQPSEIAKITLPLCITSYFRLNALHIPTWHNWWYLLSVIAITFFLILKQPDLGTALIVGGSGILVLLIAGLPRHYFITGIVAIFFLAPFLWNKMHDYQKKRILVFLGQGSKKKERYHLEQSKIAVGSGKLYGKGFLQGTQKNLKFLPENRTDFIFSVLCEEYGFIGASVVLFLYILLIYTLFAQCSKITDFHGYLLACGLVLPFSLAIACNTAMVVGLAPIVGIPLPCMSYGLTNIWITCISLGITNNILAYSKD